MSRVATERAGDYSPLDSGPLWQEIHTLTAELAEKRRELNDAHMQLAQFARWWSNPEKLQRRLAELEQLNAA